MAGATPIVEFEGLQSFISSINTVKEGMLSGFRKGLIEAIQIAFDYSQYLVPKDTLQLMYSGTIEGHLEGNMPSMEIHYNTGYAVYVHEDMAANHAPPTQAKYVESAILEKRDAMRDAIVRNTGGGFRGGFAQKYNTYSSFERGEW